MAKSTRRLGPEIGGSDQTQLRPVIRSYAFASITAPMKWRKHNKEPPEHTVLRHIVANRTENFIATDAVLEKVLAEQYALAAYPKGERGGSKPKEAPGKGLGLAIGYSQHKSPQKGCEEIEARPPKPIARPCPPTREHKN